MSLFITQVLPIIFPLKWYLPMKFFFNTKYFVLSYSIDVVSNLSYYLYILVLIYSLTTLFMYQLFPDVPVCGDESCGANTNCIDSFTAEGPHCECLAGYETDQDPVHNCTGKVGPVVIQIQVFGNRDSHYEENMAVRPSYQFDENLLAGKMAPL